VIHFRIGKQNGAHHLRHGLAPGALKNNRAHRRPGFRDGFLVFDPTRN
jgi:hypothetical protein